MLSAASAATGPDFSCGEPDPDPPDRIPKIAATSAANIASIPRLLIDGERDSGMAAPSKVRFWDERIVIPKQNRGPMRPASLHRQRRKVRFARRFHSARPDMKHPTAADQPEKLAQFPNTPNALPLIPADISDVVFAQIVFRPTTVAAVSIVFAFDGECPDPIGSVAAQLAFVE